jgi:hypothetical protein
MRIDLVFLDWARSWVVGVVLDVVVEVEVGAGAGVVDQIHLPVARNSLFRYMLLAEA